MENLREGKEFFEGTVIPHDKTSRIPQKFVRPVSSDQLVCYTVVIQLSLPLVASPSPSPPINDILHPRTPTVATHS